MATDRVVPLINLATRLRKIQGVDLEEAVSTRLLVYAATLINDGMAPLMALEAAVVEPLSDDDDVKQGLLDLVKATYG